jgi:hypothetical protein
MTMDKAKHTGEEPFGKAKQAGDDHPAGAFGRSSVLYAVPVTIQRVPRARQPSVAARAAR